MRALGSPDADPPPVRNPAAELGFLSVPAASVEVGGRRSRRWSAVSGWRSVVDQILALDPDDEEPADLSDAELLSTVEDLQAAINKLTARQARVVRTADVREVYRHDGMGSMKSWLTGRCRLSGRDAAGLVRAGRRLEELPEVEAAFAAGELTAAHVAVVTAAVTPTRVDSAERHGISQRFSQGLSGQVSGVGEPAGGVGAGDGVQRGGDRGVQRLAGAWRACLHQGLRLAEGLLDRGQVRGV